MAKIENPIEISPIFLKTSKVKKSAEMVDLLTEVDCHDFDDRDQKGRRLNP